MNDTVETITLAFKDYIFCKRESLGYLKDINVESYVHHEFQEVSWAFKKKFATREAVLKSSYTYPASFWQQFKQDHMPKWFISKFPVIKKSKEVEFLATEVFPEVFYENHSKLQLRFYAPLERIHGTI